MGVFFMSIYGFEDRFMYLYSIDILGYSFQFYGVVSHSYFVVVIVDSAVFLRVLRGFTCT